MFLGTLMRASCHKWSTCCALLLSPALSTLAQPYGLDSRAPIGAFLNGVLPPDAPRAATGAWTTVEAFPNLSFDDPVFLTFEPRTNRLYVCERQGKIWHFVNSPATSSKTLLLDLTAQTQGWDDCGVMGIAFHPEFNQPSSTNRNFVYVYYQFSPAPTAGPNRPPQGTPGYNRLSRFTVNPATGTAAGELILINQFDEGVWHNGGGIFFGADGYLYLSNGDEGAANDSYNNTQMINAGLFSGVLRIDVNQDPARSHPIRRQPANGGTLPGGAGWVNSSTANYFIPNDNPWVNPNGSVLEEFYAVGLRSPHRMTRDPLTQRIWLGDVGQGSWEEVDIIEKGGNYQWAYMEGLHTGPKAKPGSLIGTDKPPVYDYAHANGNNCVIGGYVYRGAIHAADLGGKYIFGDNGSGRIWSLTYDGTNAAVVTYLCNMPAGANYSGLSSFGVDQDNELYMCKMGRPSKIYKLGRTGPGVPEPPALLSQTAAFASLASLTPSSGIIPFHVNSPLWSDAAAKQRWLAVPNDGGPYTTNENIAFTPTGEWSFPAGTVFIKHFELPVSDLNPALRKRLETRLLVRDTNGSVYGVTYKWRADNSDADLLTNSVNEAITIATATGTRTQTWYYPSRQDCITCHNPNAKHVLGVKTHQLNGDYGYPGGVTDNQLRTWNHLGLFNPPLNETNIPSYPKAVSVTNQSGTLEHRVRSYLDANCAHCHRPNGVQAYFDARFDTPLASQGITNGQVGNDLGIPGARVVAPLNVPQSIMHLRMNSLDAIKMPPLAKNLVDTQAVATLAAWINSLTPPNAPPSVALSSPKSNDAFTASSPVNLIATASDSDGAIAKVEFFANGTKIGEDSISPFEFAWTPIAAGTYLLTAVATDDDGTNAISGGVSVIVNSLTAGSTNLLVSASSFWRYLDNGSDQGINWRGTDFNDGSWASGPAQLGYGDGDEATVVNSGPANNYFITTYFRRTFEAQGVEAYTNLALRVRRDDGIIVYLNGDEIYRNNLPTGAVSFATLASASAADDGNTWFSTNVAPARLQNGTNWLAAEIHQRAANSTDISFDLELSGTRGVLVTNPPPVIVLVSPTNTAAFDAPAIVPLGASVTSNGWTISKVEFFSGTTLIADATNNPYSANWSNVPAGVYSLSARALYASGSVVTSTFATISVIALVATTDSYVLNEDALLAVASPGVLGNDSGRGTLTATLAAPPAFGQLALSPDGSFSYAPNANFHGTDSFIYMANNGSIQSAATTVTLVINPVNDPPLSFAQNRTTGEDTPLYLVLEGSDIEGSPLNYAILAGPAHGVLSGMPPNVTYTPSNNFFGADIFTFKVNDGQLDSAPATVSITISAVNDPPVAVAQDQTTVEDTAINFNLIGEDIEGATLSYAIVTGPAHGVLSGTAPNLTYTPSSNFFGMDAFTFKVNDGQFDSAAAMVSITIAAVNDPPVATSQNRMTAEDAPLNLVLTGEDTEGSALSYIVITAPPHGVLSGTPPNLFYTPSNNFFGTDAFTFKVNDGQTDSAPATVSITIAAVNDPPVAVAQDQTTVEDTAINFNLSGEDIEGSALSYTIVTAPMHGVLSGTPPNPTYTPSTNFFGTDIFTFKVNDGQIESAPATVSITIVPANDPPMLSGLSDQSINEDQSTGELVFFVYDAETGGDALALVRSSSNLELLPIANIVLGGSDTNRTVTVTPAGNQSGTATVTLTVTDTDGASTSASFQVTVNAVNDPPTISAIADQEIDEDISTAPLEFAIADVETAADTLSLAAISSNPAIVPETGIVLSGSGANRTVTVTPAANQHGSAIIALVVTDAGGASATNSFSVVVSPVNDSPTISGIAGQTINEDTATAALAFSVTDVETSSDDLMLSWHSSNPVLIPTNNLAVSGTGTNRSLTVTPAANQFGIAIVQLVVTDNAGASATNEFSIIVEPVNDAPTLDPITDLVLDENAGPQTIMLSGISPGQPNEDQLLSLLVFSSDPVLIPAPAVDYLSPSATGTLTFAPAAQASGIATLTVAVVDGGDSLRGGTNRFSRSFQVRVVPIPTLRISLIGSRVLVSWPASAIGYQLYSRSDLSPGSVWNPVTTVPTSAGSDRLVELEAGEGQSWFRLSKPQ